MIGLSSAESEYYALTKGGCSRLGLQSLFAHWNLKLQLSLHTDSSSAKAAAPQKRSWQEHSSHSDEDVVATRTCRQQKHLRVVKVATESNPADMLTKALGRSKMEEFCEEIGQTEPRAKTVDKKPKEAKRAKTVKFAVDTNDGMIQNKLKDSRIAKIKNETKDAKLRWMCTVD